MKSSKTLLPIVTLLLFTGCIQPSINQSSNYNNLSGTQTLTFSTNEHNFMHSLSNITTAQERNNYMDEFLLKSDIQCANFLNQPLQKTDDTTKNDSLYINIAEGVSSLFGLGYITNTAKAVFGGNSETSNEEKKAYANALSPEMRKGVEIARTRFAKEMRKKQALPLDKYSIENLKEDTLKYDKQCNLEYGLIEINRALKEMQSQMNRSVITKEEPTPTLDPQVIKDKVTQATQEVKEKQENQKQENNQTTILSI